MLIPVESCLLLQNFVYECLYNPKSIVYSKYYRTILPNKFAVMYFKCCCQGVFTMQSLF
jgi:hypothetical protein